MGIFLTEEKQEVLIKKMVVGLARLKQTKTVMGWERMGPQISEMAREVVLVSFGQLDTN